MKKQPKNWVCNCGTRLKAQYMLHRSVIFYCLLSALLNWFMSIWAEQHALYTQFLPNSAMKESNLPKQTSKVWQRYYCLIYILWLKAKKRSKLLVDLLMLMPESWAFWQRKTYRILNQHYVWSGELSKATLIMIFIFLKGNAFPGKFLK